MTEHPVSSPDNQQAPSLWTAPANSRYAPLRDVLVHPSGAGVDTEVLREEARRDVEARVSAYRTPVTHETLRRCVP